MAKQPGHRIEVAGEEFEIEDPRTTRRAPPDGLGARQTKADDDADAPPTQEERMEAFKALAAAEAQVVRMFKQLGGPKGSRRTSLAISWVEVAFMWASRHVAMTKTPWR